MLDPAEIVVDNDQRSAQRRQVAGIARLQAACARGCRAWRATCDSSKLCGGMALDVTLQGLGVTLHGLYANVAIDYRSERFEDVAKDCDVVLDSAGGDTLVRCFECVKPGGVVVSINSSTPSPAFARSWGLNPIIVFAIRVLSRKTLAAARKHKARYEYFFVHAEGEQLREIARLVESGAITPLVDKVFRLEEVRDALAYSESGPATGKVIIKVV